MTTQVHKIQTYRDLNDAERFSHRVSNLTGLANQQGFLIKPRVGFVPVIEHLMVNMRQAGNADLRRIANLTICTVDNEGTPVGSGIPIPSVPFPPTIFPIVPTFRLRSRSATSKALTWDRRNLSIVVPSSGYNAVSGGGRSIVASAEADGAHSVTSMQDVGAAFVVGALVGKFIRWTSGVNTGFVRSISANTANLISWSATSQLKVAPTTGDKYQVFDGPSPLAPESPMRTTLASGIGWYSMVVVNPFTGDNYVLPDGISILISGHWRAYTGQSIGDTSHIQPQGTGA